MFNFLQHSEILKQGMVLDLVIQLHIIGLLVAVMVDPINLLAQEVLQLLVQVVEV